MNDYNDEIKFYPNSINCCVGITDIVNSTLTTAKMTNSNDIRKYYSIFINTMATVAANFGAKIVKNVGDSVIYYFPTTADLSNKHAFQTVLECCVDMSAADSVINDS